MFERILELRERSTNCQIVIRISATDSSELRHYPEAGIQTCRNDYSERNEPVSFQIFSEKRRHRNKERCGGRNADMFPIGCAVLPDSDNCVPKRYALFECYCGLDIIFFEAHADRILICRIGGGYFNLNIGACRNGRVFQVCKYKRIVSNFVFRYY